MVTPKDPLKPKAKPRGKPFQKGVSGNPKGRPPEGGPLAIAKRMLVGAGPELIGTALALAAKGDVPALKLCLERILPSLKAKDDPITVQLPEATFASQAKTVIEKIASGELSTGDGVAVISALQGAQSLADKDELIQRIEKLEALLEAKLK